MKKSALIKHLAWALFLHGFIAQAQMGYIVGTWAAAPMRTPAENAGKSGETLREIVRVTIPGGDFTHVTLSNEFGSDPLTVGAVTLAHRIHGSRSDTPVTVTFGDKPNITIAPGARAISDPTHFQFPAQSEVVVSLYVPTQPIHSLTAHGISGGNGYIAPGDQTASPELSGSRELTSWRYLVELDVSTATQSSVVCLGDDLTSSSGNMRWPDRLATRMLADQRLHQRYGILNESITGNRLLADGEGPSAINRLERDVFDSSGYYANGLESVGLMFLWQTGDEVGVAGGDALFDKRLGHGGDELQETQPRIDMAGALAGLLD